MVRNVAWGLMTALWGALALSFVSGVIALLSVEERAELTQLGGYSRLVTSYVLGAVAAGMTLGAMRGIGRTRLGRHTLGGLVTAAAFLGFLVGMGGGDVARVAVVVVPTTFLVGFIAAPLWAYGQQKGFWPDFDAWIGNLVLTDESEE